MNSFFDIETERKKSQEQYLASVSSPVEKERVAELFASGNTIIKGIQTGLVNRPPELPIILVNSSERIIAEGIEGIIEISHGFINYCLAVPSVPLDHLVKAAAADPPMPHWLPNALFSWTMAHEYWHGIRRHNAAIELATNSHATARAIEIDADLCAAASLYRWAQFNLSPRYADLTVRQIVLSLLFWALRRLPDSQDSKTHPSKFERIYHLFMKLCTLRANPADPADLDASTAESRGTIEPLSNVLFRCEETYKSIEKDDPESMIDFFRTYISSEGWRRFTDSWDELRPVVQAVSGTQT